MNEKILIVDDDPSMVRLIEHILQCNTYQVLTANNGFQALKIAKSEELDIIILDLMLPGVDGFEVCHQLRDDPGTAKLPILILSGKNEEKDMAEAFKVGANAYMSKPVKPLELHNQIQDLLAQKTAAAIHSTN